MIKRLLVFLIAFLVVFGLGYMIVSPTITGEATKIAAKKTGTVYKGSIFVQVKDENKKPVVGARTLVLGIDLQGYSYYMSTGTQAYNTGKTEIKAKKKSDGTETNISMNDDYDTFMKKLKQPPYDKVFFIVGTGKTKAGGIDIYRNITVGSYIVLAWKKDYQWSTAKSTANSTASIPTIAVKKNSAATAKINLIPLEKEFVAPTVSVNVVDFKTRKPLQNVQVCRFVYEDKVEGLKEFKAGEKIKTLVRSQESVLGAGNVRVKEAPYYLEFVNGMIGSDGLKARLQLTEIDTNKKIADGLFTIGNQIYFYDSNALFGRLFVTDATLVDMTFTTVNYSDVFSFFIAQSPIEKKTVCSDNRTNENGVLVWQMNDRIDSALVDKDTFNRSVFVIYLKLADYYTGMDFIYPREFDPYNNNAYISTSLRKIEISAKPALTTISFLRGANKADVTGVTSYGAIAYQDSSDANHQIPYAIYLSAGAGSFKFEGIDYTFALGTPSGTSTGDGNFYLSQGTTAISSSSNSLFNTDVNVKLDSNSDIILVGRNNKAYWFILKKIKNQIGAWLVLSNRIKIDSDGYYNKSGGYWTLLGTDVSDDDGVDPIFLEKNWRSMDYRGVNYYLPDGEFAQGLGYWGNGSATGNYKTAVFKVVPKVVSAAQGDLPYYVYVDTEDHAIVDTANVNKANYSGKMIAFDHNGILRSVYDNTILVSGLSEYTGSRAYSNKVVDEFGVVSTLANRNLFFEILIK